ncbi:MAG: EVE domain-containing protein [Pyrinomonadaceae bacterium]|nr:EVE domain-containing protein [Pyrinomonadaceae bacterium]
MNYWLIKQNPESYSFSDLKKEKKTDWVGVRNYQARNFMRDMKKGDQALFYHSGKEKAVVGIAEIEKEAFPDPTAKEGDWVAVVLKAKSTFNEPVTLEKIKTTKPLENMLLLKQSRLSIVSVEKKEFDQIVKMGS